MELNNFLVSCISDKKVFAFTENSLIRGYSYYGIPKKIPSQIMDLLKTNKKLNVKVKEIRKISEINNKTSLFWNIRGDYEDKKKRHKVITDYIYKYLKGDRILDVGCGQGEIGNLILHKNKLKDYTGTEIYFSKYLKNEKNMHFILQKKSSKIPVKKNSMDTVILIDMLHHVKKDEQSNIIKDVRDKLSGKGRVILFEYSFSDEKPPFLKNKDGLEFNKLSKIQKIKALALMDWISNIVILNRKMPLPFSYRSLEDWIKLFAKNKFVLLKSEYLGFPEKFFHRGPFCLLVFSK